MTIEKDALLGIIEKLGHEDQLGELRVNKMTVNLEQKELNPSANIREEHKKNILNNVWSARNEDLTDLVKHHKAISNSLFDTGQSQTTVNEIQLKIQDLIYLKQFRIPEAQREAAQKHAEELFNLAVVRPSQSKFNNSIYIVSKLDRGLRIVHDFWAINQETLLEPYSMKNLQDSMEDLGQARSKLVLMIDLTSRFWQMFLNPECRKYTALRLPGLEQFEWNASPTRVIRAPESFQKLPKILTNIDDLLVHSKDQKQQLEILNQLFIWLCQY